MKRREFPKAVKTAVIKRATHNMQVICEACGTDTKGKWQIDHIRPDGLLGEPTLANAQLICRACYTEKNAQDVKDIAKAKRREARHIGAHKPKQSIKSAGFPKRPRNEDRIGIPPRRSLYKRGSWITITNARGAD